MQIMIIFDFNNLLWPVVTNCLADGYMYILGGLYNPTLHYNK